MYKKVYLSRATTRAMATEYPIGDPTGGAAYGEYNDPVTAAVVVGGGLVGSYMSAEGQKDAASTQANAAAAQQANLLAAGKEASKQFDPYTGAGTTALANLASNNPYFNNQFSNQDLNSNLAPNYAFQLQQGQSGLNAANNATGGFVGGNAQQALSQFNQNYAGNAYQQAFTNYQNQRSNIYGMNLNQANLGLSGATGSANAQLGTATNVAGLGIGSANAQAASQIAQGNIYGGAAQNAGNLYALSNLIGKGTPASGGNSLESLGLQYG
jgi:hypothetical protein